MRVLKVVLGCLCLLIVGTASATASPTVVASDPFMFGPATVDGSNVYYVKRAAADAGYPIAIHRVDLKTGTDTVIRSITDHDVAVTDLRAGAGRVAYVETRTNLTERNFPERAVAMDPSGANFVELFSWTFPMGQNGAPDGGIDVDWIRKSGEVIVRKLDTFGADQTRRLTLIGVRRDGTSRKFVSSTQKLQRAFAYSDTYFAWSTLHKFVVTKFDDGSKVVRPVTDGVRSVTVDDAGRILLNSFRLTGTGGSALSYFPSLSAKNATVIRSTSSRKGQVPTAHFCGSRILTNYPQGVGISRWIREIDVKGKVLRTFFAGKAGKNAVTSRDFTCDSRTVSWATMKNTSAPPAVPYTIFAQSLGN